MYSHIWLNLAKDDHHFFYNILWMIATLATNENSFKNKPSKFLRFLVLAMVPTSVSAG
jgi:hypothetical protein